MAPKRKSDGSAVSSSGVSLSELFSQLKIAASSNNFEQVLIANDVLKTSPKDSRAAKEKIIALIKLDKYKEALSFLEESSFLNARDTILERGFILYKLGKGVEAAKILDQGSGRAIDHVKAQNAYRMEEFSVALQLYAELEKSRGAVDHESEDLASNYSAARAQSTWTSGIGHNEEQRPRNAYEVSFNYAYELIALGKLEEAEQELTQAEKLCSRSGLTGDDLKAEQGIILTQLAYVKQLREETEAASKLYEDVQNETTVDSSTRAIALNNQLAIEPRANPFENHRLHSAAAAAFASSKPFLAQSRPFSANALLLASQAHKSIDASHKLHPLDYTASLVRIHRELEGVPETAFLQKLESIFYRDEKNVAAGLFLIQTQMQKSSLHAAAATLEKLFHALKEASEVKYAPGLVSLAVRLFPQVGKEEKATTLLMEAKNYWSSKEHSDPSIAMLVNYATAARVDNLLTLQPSASHSQEMATMLSERTSYLEAHPSDIDTQAVLASLYSATSASEAALYSSSLPPVSTFTKTVDSAKLEAQGIPSTATQLTAPKPKPIVVKKRRARVRGNKVFDSTHEVDPERWLPLRERSYYKPTKSKKRKTGGATQGGAVEAESMSRSGSAQVDIKKVDAGGKKKKKNRK